MHDFDVIVPSGILVLSRREDQHVEPLTRKELASRRNRTLPEVRVDLAGVVARTRRRLHSPILHQSYVNLHVLLVPFRYGSTEHAFPIAIFWSAYFEVLLPHRL